MVIQVRRGRLSTPFVSSYQGRNYGWLITGGRVDTEERTSAQDVTYTAVTGGLLDVIPCIVYYENMRVDGLAVVWDDAMPGWILPMMYGNIQIGANTPGRGAVPYTVALATRQGGRGFRARQDGLYILRHRNVGGVALSNLDGALVTRRGSLVLTVNTGFVTYGEAAELGFRIGFHVPSVNPRNTTAWFNWTSMNGRPLPRQLDMMGNTILRIGGDAFLPMPLPPAPPEAGVSGIPVALQARYDADGNEIRPEGSVVFNLSGISTDVTIPEQGLPCGLLGQSEAFEIRPFARDGTGWRFPNSSEVAGHVNDSDSIMAAYWRTYKDNRIKHQFAGADLLDMDFYIKLDEAA